MLTAQELIYLARGARMLADQARKDAERTKDSVQTFRVFEESAKEYDALATKCERLAKSAR